MLSLAGCSTKASKSDNASTTSSNASQTASEVTTTSKTNLKDSNSENTPVSYTHLTLPTILLV